MKRRITFGVFCLWVGFVSCSCLPNDESIYFEKKEGDSTELIFTYNGEGAYGIDLNNMEIKWIIRGRKFKPCYPVKSDDGRVFFVPSIFERGAKANDTIVIMNKEGKIVQRFRPWPGVMIASLDIHSNLLLISTPSSTIGIMDLKTWNLITLKFENDLLGGYAFGEYHIFAWGLSGRNFFKIPISSPHQAKQSFSYGREGINFYNYTLCGHTVWGVTKDSIYIWDINTDTFITNFFFTNSIPGYSSYHEGWTKFLGTVSNSLYIHYFMDNQSYLLLFDTETYAFLELVHFSNPGKNISPKEFWYSWVFFRKENKIYFNNSAQNAGVFCFDTTAKTVIERIPWPEIRRR
ncbi:hypothetical protein BREVNS_1923 [Brevinematales bacterium NS]|nr:hypothetical protein BREVNS_1923 [Brevinematales bacterium NS]